MIPKPGKDPRDPGNWRPITIGSLLGRLFSGAIDSRLRQSVTISERQKGFKNENGCRHNIAILGSTLASMKGGRGGVLTIVDVSKAFDTVPHAALDPTLAMKGIPRKAREYIKKMYENCSTSIRTKEGGSMQITLKRGVKQGDPLSPLLFNIIMDPIIEAINGTSQGVSLEGANVAILAFADDIVLVGKDREEASKQLALLSKYLDNLGMELSIPKCATVEVVAKGKTWYLQDPEMKLGLEEVPTIKAEEASEYLGVTLDPWIGFRVNKNKIEKVLKAANAVKRMGLKPYQKVELIRTYLIPKIIYALVANPPPIGTLKELDHEIKQVIKSILKLHPSTADGIIYADRSHGGIGLQRIENIVKMAVLRSGIKMQSSTDDAVKSALLGQVSVLGKYAQSLGIKWPATMDQVEEARKQAKKLETERWKQLISQGQGVADFCHDKVGNAWLYNPTLLKSSRYLDALKLRTNTFGTKVALRRAKKDVDATCRRCRAQIETLGHVLGNCLHTKPMRIRRHDEIKNFIKDQVALRCTVFDEPTVNVVGELKKPDLVIKDQDRLIIADVTVRYEDKDNLRKAFLDKTSKYKDTLEFVRIKTNSLQACIMPIVVGTRGAMPTKTQENLKALGMKKKDMVTISLMALRSSLEISNAFLDYDRIR